MTRNLLPYRLFYACLLNLALLFSSAELRACKADFSFVFDPDTREVTFTNLSTGGKTFLWDFGDAHVSNQHSPIHIFPNYSPMTFNVSLRISDDSSCSDSITKTVSIYTRPCQVFSYFSIISDTVNFSALVEYKSWAERPSKTTWTWHFGDGDSSNSVNPSHIYPGQGPFQLCLSMRDSICFSKHCDSIGFDSSGSLKRSIPYSIKVTGLPYVLSINPEYAASGIELMPNPCSDRLQIKIKTGYIGQVKVMNAFGKEVFSELMAKSSAELDTESWSVGIYFISINGMQPLKLVKY